MRVAGRKSESPWLLLTFTLPTKRASQRVEMWRKLQRYGAVALGNSGYLLPNSASNRERFEWLGTAIRRYGGEASVLKVESIDNLTSPQIRARFAEARTRDYQEVIRELQKHSSISAHSRAAGRIHRLRARFHEIAEIDFFGSPLRKRVEELLARSDATPAGTTEELKIHPREYVGRVWVTRPRPGIDRSASNAGDNTIGVVDIRQMKVIKKIPTEAKPDGSAYAAPFHKLYVSDERGKAEAIVDVRTDMIVKTLRFDSETGMPQYDPVAKKIYVNLQDKNIFAVIDPATDEVVGRYPVRRCKGNHGMTLDPEHHRAFLSCEDNELMTVFNLDTNQPITFLPMAGGPDVIKFDPGLKRIYVACFSGAISVFQMDDADHYHKLGDFPVQKKVHSLAVDPETHRVYAPEQEADGKAVARMAVYDAVVNP